VNSEEFARLNNVVMKIMPVGKIFYQFCEQFKARVESVSEEAA
jgi:hypothetical protein